MFETIIATFIKRYISRYFDINADQLSAQLLYKQQIIIENLTLNKTIFNEDIRRKFKLPIKIESIHIGKIQCSFVWSSLLFRSSSAAFIIKIDGVRAVIKSAIIDENESSFETSVDDDAVEKCNQLSLAEQQLEKEFECFGEVKSSKWNVQRLLMSFFEKLQIEIVDVHINYESSSLYTIGFTCTNIQITNEPTNEAMSRQVFRIINPGFYININNPSAHSYILSPSSSIEIYLIHNHFLIGQKEYRYEFECLFNDLNMRCNNEQVRVLGDIVRSIQYLSLRRMLISDPSRPRLKISKRSAKAWWRYAALTLLRMQVDSTNLTTRFWFDRSLLIHRLQRLNIYKRLYGAYLDNKYFKTSDFSSEDESRMNEIEREFNTKHLLVIRRSIFQTRINEQLNQKKETNRWYSNYAKWLTTKVVDLWGKMPASKNADDALSTSNIMEPLNETDKKLQEQVNTFIAESLEDEDLLESCQAALIFRFKLVLKSVQMDLLSSINNDILFNFCFTKLSATAEFRLRNQSILASVRLEDLYVRDRGQIDAYSTIIRSKDRSEQVPVFELKLEKKAKAKSSKQSTYSIILRSCGLCIVCCPASVERLHQFYVSAFGQSFLSLSLSLNNWKQIKTYAVTKYISVLEQIMPTRTINSKKATASYLKNIRRNRHGLKRKFHVYVDLGAPKIVIPLSSHDALIVDLGCLTLTNDTHNKDDVITTSSCTTFVQQQIQENDDEEEFLTPDSSPLANDDPLEEETTYHSINTVPSDIEYSSFQLSVRDINVEYSTNLLQIVEKFSVDFLIQHPSDHLWPLAHISCTLQKIVVHLNSQIIQSLICSIKPWITCIKNFIPKQHTQSHVLPDFVFQLNEVSILLNDSSQALCDIRLQNIDLSLTTNNDSTNLIFMLQTLTIFDCMQQSGEDRSILLKIDQTPNVNKPFIRVNIDCITASQIPERTLIVDVNADKLSFVFNPKTICTLINFLIDTDLISWSRTIISSLNIRKHRIQCKINTKLQEINVHFISITPMMLSAEVHMQNVSLNVLFHRVLTFEMAVSGVQIFHLLNDQEQSKQADLIINAEAQLTANELSENVALHLLLSTLENNDHNLSIKMMSISYFHSWRMLYTIQQILAHITQNCHLIINQEPIRNNVIIRIFDYVTRLISTIDLNTLTIIFPTNNALQLDHIRIKNSHNPSLDYRININRIDFLSRDNMRHIHHSQLLENISICLNLQISESSIILNSKSLSPLRIFFSQNRIKFLRQIIQTFSVHNKSSLFKFAFHLQPFQMIIICQTDRNHESITLCEAILDQCQISYELNPSSNKRITLQFDSLHIKDRVMNSKESLIAFKSPSFIQLNVSHTGNRHQQFDVKFGKIDIKFVKSTWTILSEMIEIYFSTTTGKSIDIKSISESQENRKHSTEISFDIDSISCLFQDNVTLLMNVNLQRFICQVQTSSKQSIVSSTINGELGSISLHDLSTIDQLYSERLCTTETNAILFTFTTEKDHESNLSNRSQFSLRMASIQYIHTHRFLLSLIDFFIRFRQNEDFLNRLQSSIISSMNPTSNGIVFNAEIENLILILPEHIQKNPVLIFQFGSVNLKSSHIDIIAIDMKDIEFYSAIYTLIDERISPSVRFSNFGFSRMYNELSSMVHERFHLNLAINHTSPTYNIKINISSIDILFDLNHYRLIQNIVAYNLNEQPSVMTNNRLHPLMLLKDNIHIDFSFIIEIDRAGLEIFILDIDLLSFNHRRSLAYAALTNLHLSFEQNSVGNQDIHLLCSTIKFQDTRIQPENLTIPLSTPSDSNQLEIHLLRTHQNEQCTLTLNSLRLLFIIDWLLEFNEYLNAFTEQQTFISNPISIKQLEVKLYLNNFELVLAPTTKDPYSSALIYSSTMIINYKTSIECFISDFTFLTCQIGNIDETSVSIIEPNDFSLDMTNGICNIHMPMLNIRLSYSDIKMIYSMCEVIIKQISEAKTRKPLLSSLSAILTSPIRDSQSPIKRFLNISFLKFICDELCLCLIDDYFGVNIPLLNINLKPFQLQTIANDHLNRTDQCEAQLYISYYNRFQSGFEPLIELCSLNMILTRSSTDISLSISTKEVMNLNFTKAMYRLYDTIKTNHQNSKNDIETKQKLAFRPVKPLEPYCLKNSLGVQIKFRTWIIAEQRFSSNEHTVDDNQTISFYFPTRSSPSIPNANQKRHARMRSSSIVASLFQLDRRLAISIDGWEELQPISIDRVGTFFRLATPLENNPLFKPILVIVDIAIADNSIRSITVKSSIEIRNQLITSIDIRFQSNFNTSHDFCLEPNEIRSLPIQICSILEQIQIRPANFALDYCDESINWFEIETNLLVEEKSINQQSFLRTCSIDGKEAVYYVCLQSKQTCLLNYQDQIFSVYQLSILPPLTICNLLPCILNFEIPSYPQKFQLNAYKSHREHALNIMEEMDIIFATHLFRMNKPLHLPSINDLYQMKYNHQRVIFYDNNQRELFVDITIVCVIKHRLKISVSVPYVLLNKSGIPLIFKDANSRIESAGQSTEDESALNREPLLFSFDNSNRNNTCLMRVGTDFHRHQDGRPQWSQRFSLEHGSTHRQLQVRSSRNSSDWNYSIGIDVRPGNGQLKKINFIFLSARYMICNQCSYDLLISPRQLIDEASNHLHVSQHATVAYHWPRTDIEQILCARVIDEHQYELVNWSGGFQIDTVDAFHINMRNENGQCLILRVQIIERNSTYFVVFMDSNKMPAPFRLCNRSDIPIQFYQTDTREEFSYLRTSIEPHQSIDYTWDELTSKPTLTCSILDGSKAIYDLLKLGSGDDLFYQNYIYLAFQETFDDENLLQFYSTNDSSDPLSRQLVIEYIDNQLILAQRQENKQSQLWQMTSTGVLIHVGSTSLYDSIKKKEQFDDLRQTFVLDIKDLGDQILSNLMTEFTSLTVRRYDSKRSFTQTWQFLDNGCLCLANTQMCIQVFGELKASSDVVLGPIIENENLSPFATMHIRSHQRYPGSGVLYVRVIPDGPTNVLEIDHIKSNDLPVTTNLLFPTTMNYHLDLHFPAGVGISVIGSIDHESEELIYVFVNNVHIGYNDKDNEQSIEATIDSLIISNQLLTTIRPCLLYTSFSEDSSVQSAIGLQVNWQKLETNFTLIHIIRSLHIDINSITIQLDEILLWKLVDFFGIEISSFSSILFSAIGIGSKSNSDRKIDLNINDYETERILSLPTSTHATRVYFNKLYLSSIDLNLSIHCIHSKRSLPSHLLSIKRRASFPLVPFENAQIHLKSYEQTHISNTYDFFLLSIMTHYVNACKRQAFKILGSVDFLGNPLGLFHDVTDGLSCLVDQRSVSGLVKNVAHGVANSTSKVTGSLSHGLGKLVPDDRRQVVPDNHRSSTIGQAIRHGTAGIAAGFYGGLTSMIKQPYKGVVEEGVPGFVKGFAKGIVGTVSKPMVGILDFTSEMATAIKEGSRSPNTLSQNRIRLTRCPANILGLLQSYSTFDAQGHNLLYKMNKGNLNERYISRLTLLTSDKRLNTSRNKSTLERKDGCIDAMITTQRVIIYRIDDDSDEVNFEIIDSYDFSTPMIVVPIDDDDSHVYIQFIFDSNPSHRSSNKPNVSMQRCDTLEQASILSRDIQRAQNIFQEEKMLYIPSDDETEDNYNDNLDE